MGAKMTESAALNLAVNGFTVFPIKAGKKAPPLVRFTQQATGDPNEVAELWRQHPDANIGVRTGRTIVLDSDSADAARFVAELGLPETTTAKTPRGGKHFYLKGSAPTRTGVRPGLDIRGKDGYAVGAGSVVNGRRYEWVIPPWEVPPQPAPQAVLELATERARFQVLDERPIPQGRRNESLTRIAGWFVGQGIRGETLRDALQGANRRRCKPPLPEQEVDKIVKSANSWAEPPLWLVDPLRFAEDPRLDLKAHALLVTLALRAGADGSVRGGRWLEGATRLSRHSLYRAAQELEEYGRIRVRRPSKLSHANSYKLLPAPTAVPTGMGVATCDTGGGR